MDSRQLDSLATQDAVFVERGLRVLAWVGVCAAALWLVMSMTYPFGWDQGILAWAGGIVLAGGMPYADAWDMKGPLAYYVFAISQALFGVHLWSIRVLDAALLAAAALSLYRIAAVMFASRAAAQWATLVFVLWYASHSFWHTAQPDGWAGMLLVIGLQPLLSSRTLKPSHIARAGVCAGAITLLKPVYAAFLFLPLAYLWLAASERRLRRSTIAVAAWLLPLALAAGWFAVRGALDDLWAVHIRYSALYAGLNPGNPARGLVEYFLSKPVISVAAPALIYGGIALWRDASRPTAVVLLCWSALVFVIVALQGRFYAYHWLPLLPAATLIGTAGLYALWARARLFAALQCGAVVVHSLAPIALEEVRFAAWVAGRMDHGQYYDAYGDAGHEMRAARWLRESKQPGPVFVFGWNTAVAWLSQRETVSRFGFSMPLLLGDGLEARSLYRAELLDALRRSHPQYIVVGTQSEQIMGQRLTIADFPELAALLETDYRPAARFGQLDIHERVNP